MRLRIALPDLSLITICQVWFVLKKGIVSCIILQWWVGLETIPLYFWQDEIESLKHKKAIKLCEEKMGWG